MTIEVTAGTCLVEAGRLSLRHFTPDDADFIHELLSEPGWLRFIGDRGVDSRESALAFIRDKLVPAYRSRGLGFLAVERRSDGERVGMCGLVKRDWLEDADLGYALLARHEGYGYAIEAACGVLRHARERCGLSRLAAIVDPDNTRSRLLLERLGFERDGEVTPPDEAVPLCLYRFALGPSATTGD